MSRYEFPIRRAAFGAAAVAMTALTFALAVIMPAMSSSGSQSVRAVAANRADVPVVAEPAANPLRIDVYGTREQTTAFDRSRLAAPNRRQGG